MGTIGAALRRAREQRGWNQLELAERLPSAQTLVSKRENDKLNVPSVEIERFVTTTGVPLLLTPAGWEVYDPPTHEVPSYGRVPCGHALPIEEERAADLVGLRELTGGAWRESCCFLVQAEGDSMEPTIADGDWLTVERRDGHHPRLWDLVVVVVDGRTVVAQVQPHPDRAGEHTLGKLNQRYTVDLGDESDVRLLGIITGALRWRPLRA